MVNISVTTSHEIMDEVVEAVTTCKLCQTSLTSPKLLTCQHSFCLSCLETHLTGYHGKPSFPCPACEIHIKPPSSQETVDSETASRLPADKFTEIICRSLQGENKDGASSCDRCVNTPEFMCTDCSLSICETCKNESHPNCSTSAVSNQEDLDQQCRMKFENLQEKFSMFKTLCERRKQTISTAQDDAKAKVDGYYRHTRERVFTYIDRQQQKIANHVDSVLDAEFCHVSNNLTLNTSLLENMKDWLDMMTHLKNENTERLNACANYAVAHFIEPELQGHHNALPHLRESINKTLNMRLMINTELEDSLTDGVFTEQTPLYNDIGSSQRVLTRLIPTAPELSISPSASDDNNLHSNAEVSNENNEDILNAICDTLGIDMDSSKEQREAIVPSAPPPDFNGDDTADSQQDTSETDNLDRSDAELPNNQGTAVNSRDERDLYAEIGARPRDNHFHGTDVASDELPSYSEAVSFNMTVQDRYEYSNDAASLLTPTAPPLYLFPDSDSLPDLFTSREEPVSSSSSSLPSLRLSSSSSKYNQVFGIEDEKPPNIVGIVCVGDNYLLVDHENCILKLVDKAFESMKSIRCQNFTPWDVAKLSNEESIVAAPTKKRFFKVQHDFFTFRLNVSNSLKVERGYTCVAYSKEEQLVCGTCPPFSNAAVDILKMDGSLQRSIRSFPDLLGPSLFSYPRTIAVTGEGHVIIYDQNKKHVIFIDIRNAQVNFFCKFGAVFHGIAIFPEHRCVLMTDTNSDELYISNYEGTEVKVLDHLPSRDVRRVAVDVSSLAIASGNGYVRILNFNS